ncbi:MAG: hypothetical protein IPJ06_00675 [Saprospiraceae bacterium]|nr:hypothetical protein [Saprospiraceae bacterium]
MLPFTGKTQAHLGSSLVDLKAMYPDKNFKIEYANDGTSYTAADHLYGTFVYYFDKETGLTKYCIQIPDNMPALNAQVEAYNNKYVIVSETSWRAYLEGGGILKINLSYDDENDIYIFYYTN